MSSLILQLNIIVDRAIATLLAVGGVSALRYGDSLVRVPFGAVNSAWSTAIYPALVRASRSPVSGELGTATERVVRYAIVVFVPLAVLTVAVAPVATAAAYDRGSFSAADLALTAGVVAASAPLIVTLTIRPILVGALNARRKGMVLLAAGALDVVSNLTLNVAFGLALGVVGVALATSLSTIIIVIFMSRVLATGEAAFSLRALGRTFLRSLLATLPGALVFGVPIWSGVVPADLLARLGLLVVVGVTGVAMYIGIARRIGLDEASAISAFGVDSARRLRRRLISPAS